MNSHPYIPDKRSVSHSQWIFHTYDASFYTVGYKRTAECGYPLLELTVSLHYLHPSCMRQNVYYRNLKWSREDSLPCYCYAIKPSSRTIGTQVLQLASADGKQRSWVNCELITAQPQDREPGSCALWVSYLQINCQCKN